MTTPSGDNAESSTPVETGYRWLGDAQPTQSHNWPLSEPPADAPIIVDDKFFHPIHRTV